MKFWQYGYTTKEVQVREISMADVALTIAQTLIKRDRKDMEVRIVDCFMGEVEIYNGMEELLSHDWSSSYKVNVYDWACMHDNENDKDYIKVVIADEVE